MMKKWRPRASVFVLLLFAFWLSSGPWAFASEPAVDYFMDSRDIPPKNGDPQSEITIKTAVPDPDAVHPNDPNAGNGSGNPSANPGEASGGGSTSPENANPETHTRTPDANAPGDSSSGGASPGDTSDPSSVNSENWNTNGTNPDTADPKGANPNNGTHPNGVNPNGANANDADPGSANPHDANPNEANPENAKKPWYEALWDKTKYGVKGGIAGAIGAGIVIGVVVVGAAILGVTVGAPLIIAALAAGIVAGAIYGIMAGDSFSWIKGIGIGGMAALSVISLGQLGIGAAIRGGISLFRSAGLRGAMRAAGSRALGLLRGAFGGVKNGLAALARSPLGALGSALKSKAFGISFGLGFVGNYFGHMAATGRIPSFKETLSMAAVSFAGALLLDGIFRGVRMVKAMKGNETPVAPKPERKPDPPKEPPKKPDIPPKVRYSGKLVKVPKPDPNADKLAERLGGQSRMKFDSDPDAREFDVITDEYIVQTKSDMQSFGKKYRKQLKATFEAAKVTGRGVYLHFESQPSEQVIKVIQKYEQRYGIEVVIDISPL
jgi:hypothetical protein